MGGPGNIQLAGHIFTLRQRIVTDLNMGDVQGVGFKNVKQILLSDPLPICEKVVVRKGSEDIVSVTSNRGHHC